MKAKTISKILTGKFISWTKSIEDEAVRKRVEDNTIITGGSIVSLLMNESVNDFDIYFRDVATAHAVAEYYVKKLKESPPPALQNLADEVKVVVENAIPEGGEVRRIGGYAGLLTKGPQPARVRIITDNGHKNKVFRGEEAVARYEDYQTAQGEITDPTEPTYEGNTEALDDISSKELQDKADEKKRGKYRVLFVTANAITLSDGIQIVLRFQGEPEEIHKNYDFVHCLNHWCSWNKELTLHKESLLCIMNKELRYQGSKYPIASLIRTRKFITRGWTINAGQYVKMAFQIGELDLRDPAVLEDQLVGVDSAYFTMLISQLTESIEKKMESDPNASNRIDASHLLTLIDKIF
jgi:hypothetical protein